MEARDPLERAVFSNLRGARLVPVGAIFQETARGADVAQVVIVAPDRPGSLAYRLQQRGSVAHYRIGPAGVRMFVSACFRTVS